MRAEMQRDGQAVSATRRQIVRHRQPLALGGRYASNPAGSQRPAADASPIVPMLTKEFRT